MTCQLCPSTGPLYRINEKGVPGIFRCDKHLAGNEVDPSVREVAETIAS